MAATGRYLASRKDRRHSGINGKRGFSRACLAGMFDRHVRYYLWSSRFNHWLDSAQDPANASCLVSVGIETRCHVQPCVAAFLKIRFPTKCRIKRYSSFLMLASKAPL